MEENRTRRSYIIGIALLILILLIGGWWATREIRNEGYRAEASLG